MRGYVRELSAAEAARAEGVKSSGADQAPPAKAVVQEGKPGKVRAWARARANSNPIPNPNPNPNARLGGGVEVRVRG